MAGVTVNGFEKKTLEDVKGEVESSLKADVSPSLNFQVTGPLGQLLNIFSDKIREAWDLAQAIYRSLYPDTASGDALDNIASLTGVIRLAAKSSEVTVTCTGTPSTFLPAGRVVKVASVGDRFQSIADATIGGGGTVDVEFESIQTGPIAAPAATLTEIETPVSGWASATNALDAVLGRDLETDADLRKRRIALLQSANAASLEGLRARLLQVDDVTEVFIFENTASEVDEDGLPGHSFESVVQGGDDQELFDEIFLRRAAGISSHGSEVGSSTDTQGIVHEEKFSRPTDVDIYVELTVKTDPVVFGGGDPAQGEILVKQAIVDESADQTIGEDVIALNYKCVPLLVAGVIDVTVFKIDKVTPAVGTVNIPMQKRELAVFDTSRITVTVVT